MCGGGSASNSTSQAANSTTVNVQSTTDIPISVDTTDLADAISALAGAQQQSAQLASVASVYTAQESAAAQVASAQIAAGAGPTWSTVLIGVAAILGLAFTAGLIKLPKGLKA